MAASACEGGGASVQTGAEGVAELGGKVIVRETEWSVTESPEVEVWGDSGSGKFTNRKTTRLDATGSITGKMDCEKGKQIYSLAGTNQRIVEIHTELVLWEQKGTRCYWAFPCSVITNFNVTVDMDTNKATVWSFDFGSDGPYYRPEDPSAPSHQYPDEV